MTHQQGIYRQCLRANPKRKIIRDKSIPIYICKIEVVAITRVNEKSLDSMKVKEKKKKRGKTS